MVDFINWFTDEIIIKNINNTKTLNSAFANSIFKLINRLLNHQLFQ